VEGPPTQVDADGPQTLHQVERTETHGIDTATAPGCKQGKGETNCHQADENAVKAVGSSLSSKERLYRAP
jgi:hypothetical protein